MDEQVGAKERQLNLRVMDARVVRIERVLATAAGFVACMVLGAILSLLAVAILSAQGVEERERKADALLHRLESALTSIEAERAQRLR